MSSPPTTCCAKDFSWLKNDSWVKNNVQDLEAFKSYLIQRGLPTCAGEFDGAWHGAIKLCPECDETRVTDCCACGCGSCYTCGGRHWICTPVNIQWADLSGVFEHNVQVEGGEE
jgi:hypothetical protein